MNAPSPIVQRPRRPGFDLRGARLAALAAALLLGSGCEHFRPPSAEDKLNRKTELEREKMRSGKGSSSQFHDDEQIDRSAR